MSEFKRIPKENLEVDPENVRKEADLDEQIIDSIKEKGIIQNLMVRPKKGEENKYLITVGKRRFLAGRRAGIKKFPCEVREELKGDDVEAMATSIAENKHRLDLSYGQWAEALGIMCDKMNADPRKEETVENISEMTGMSRREVKRHLEIADMPDWFVELTKEPEEQDLPEWIRAISKKPENRSDSEMKSLEQMCAAHIRGGELEGIHQIDLEQISDGTLAEELARDEDFARMARETPLKAFEVANNACEEGRGKVKKVLGKAQTRAVEDKIDNESSKRKKSAKQEFGSGVKNISIELGKLEYVAAKKAMNDHERIDELSQMVLHGFISYLRRKGYYG